MAWRPERAERAFAKSMATTIISADSGLGGLSVVAEIHRTIPGLRHVYVCDNAYFPYGLRDDADLRDHFLRVMARVFNIERPDIVVAACNTISTLCLPELRSIAKAPVVGVVPAIKPAAALSKKRVIGLLATSATIERAYTERLIAEFAKDCRVIRVGSAELVDLAEAKLLGEVPDRRTIERILAPFFQRPDHERPDVVVLACTHFPLLREELVEASPPGVQWIDSGEAIARRAAHLLESSRPLSLSAGPDLAIVTGSCDQGLEMALRRFGFATIQAWAGD
jgi:glutamate racemase